MEIHDGTPHMEAPDWSQYPSEYSEKRVSAQLLEALKHPAFLFFLQSQIPGAQLYRRAIGSPAHHELCKVFLLGKNTATIRKSGMVEKRGEIWERIERAYQHYTGRGEPGLEDYQVSVQGDGSVAIGKEYVDLTGDGTRLRFR
jgi:hypothetical protein